MAVLGIDWGERRIGLAVSDPDGIVALPAGAIERRDLAQDLEAIRSLAREREIEEIVVGLPIHLNGRKGEAAQRAEAFAQSVRESTGLPVTTLDERFTSAEAARSLRETGPVTRKRRRESLDTMAATLLLRTYLARRAGGVS